MKILAIDTVTEGCSAALYIEGDWREQFEETPRGHTDRILPMVDALLSEADISLQQLDTIAFDRGPGSFTGLRITAGIVQGLAFGAELPVVPVSSLAALALRAAEQTGANLILSAIDARMNEVYWGTYQIDEAGFPQLVGEEAVLPSDSVPIPRLKTEISEQWVGVGSGWKTYRENLEARFSNHLGEVLGDELPHAAEIAKLAIPAVEAGNLLLPEEVQLVYLRNKVVS